jgi:hypothetical protein
MMRSLMRSKLLSSSAAAAAQAATALADGGVLRRLLHDAAQTLMRFVHYFWDGTSEVRCGE